MQFPLHTEKSGAKMHPKYSAGALRQTDGQDDLIFRLLLL